MLRRLTIALGAFLYGYRPSSVLGASTGTESLFLDDALRAGLDIRVNGTQPGEIVFAEARAAVFGPPRRRGGIKPANSGVLE